jgi:toxin ParE1/3/4
LLEAVERLAELPNLGRPGRVAGTRELVVPGTPYVIPYRLRGERLEVIAVFHGRQKWPKRL